MAARSTAPSFLAKSFQKGRPTTNSASAPAASHWAASPVRRISPAKSLQKLHHQPLDADRRPHGIFTLGTNLVPTSSLCFATGDTGGTTQDQSPSLEDGIESGEEEEEGVPVGDDLVALRFSNLAL